MSIFFGGSCKTWLHTSILISKVEHGCFMVKVLDLIAKYVNTNAHFEGGGMKEYCVLCGADSFSCKCKPLC